MGQDSSLEVMDAEACALNCITWSLPHPSPSVPLSATLTPDPGNSHSPLRSAAPAVSVRGQLGELAVLHGNVSKSLLFAFHILYVELFNSLLLFLKITGVGKLPATFSPMS